MTDRARSPVFYAPQLGGTDDTITLSAEEARHATGARRLRDGDVVFVMNGQGAAVRGTVRKDGASTIVNVNEVLPEQPDFKVPVHLAAALPRGDRLSTLMDMATQIGLSSFTPLVCERSSQRLRGRDRLERIMLSAAKQSRRFRLPAMRPEQTLPDYVQSELSSAGSCDRLVLIAHPRGADLSELLKSVVHPRACTLLVGPEGGFTEAEVQQAENAGARRVGLGSYVLRIEAACVVALTQLHVAFTE